MAASAAARSVTPAMISDGGAASIEVGSVAPIGTSSTATASATVEPGGDVLRPADVCPLSRDRLVEVLGHLVDERAFEVEALDRREVSQELAERGILRAGWLDADLGVERRRGRHVARRRSERRRARVEEEAAQGDADAEGQRPNDGDRGDAPGARRGRLADGRGHVRPPLGLRCSATGGRRQGTSNAGVAHGDDRLSTFRPRRRHR